MNAQQIETLSNTITSKQAQELLDKSLKREQEDKCIIKAIDHLQQWEGNKVQREFNDEVGFQVTTMKDGVFEVVKAIRFEDSVIYQAPFYVWEHKNKLERVENPVDVKRKEFNAQLNSQLESIIERSKQI